jgi:cytochrome c biogenesis protein
MATSETEVKTEVPSMQAAAPVKVRAKKQDDSIIDKVLKLLSSVRFGLVMLSLLLICSMIGMLIMQVEVEGFQEYFAKLTPAQKLIYTKLDLNNIYHSWYFTALLAITALNIILASIDRFPTAWQYVINPKLKASPNFIRAQTFTNDLSLRESSEDLAAKIAANWKNHKIIRSATTGARLMVLAGFGLFFLAVYFLFEHTILFWLVSAITVASVIYFVLFALRFDIRISEENGRRTVFGQLNAWNRLGAYSVHVALLTIFVGGMLTAKMGVGGSMEIIPGDASDAFVTFQPTLEGPVTGPAKLPFIIECTDLQQKLIRQEGGLQADNTIDWLSYVRIKDGDFTQDAVVHLNNPYDYKGYRLFQSKFTAYGFARSVKIRLEPVSGGQAIDVPPIPRNGTVTVEGIGRITYRNFFPDFEITDSGPNSASGDYNKPAAQLEIVSPDGTKRGAFAFSAQLAEQYLSNIDEKNSAENMLLVNGNKVLLVDFEKAAMGHTLAVQYDPGRIPVYIGFLLLVASLCGVFFFSHQRVWAVVEPAENGSKVYIGGNTNRNRPAFEERFNSLVESVTGGGKYE